MDRKLEPYIPMVDFLSKALGEYYEIVLHDLSNPKHSIIAIANGCLSGRTVGDTASDFVLRTVKYDIEQDTDCVVNYRINNVNGHLFRSSGYYIRNDEGILQGMLCINFNITPFVDLREKLTKHIIGNEFFLENTCKSKNKNNEISNVFQHFQGSMEDVTHMMIEHALAKYSVAPERLSVDERISVVHDLNDTGLFLLKGGVASLAEWLDVSEPTIYRYLGKIKRKNE
ncbi:MAG: PAS domain-containing protein [Megasphaera sp.]|jgi:predicted transcriptional regulator YheO|uniref:helix-turn-helix transcriptional regulator n=1 Tax=Megasphaera sueciensis TaxID=349094 RepID=UPI003CFF00D5|nr:PAS domain-containing protein [Megasphaera sp.]MCI1823959.1 PAS domain-containing protein [Megasphaera sp.]